MNKENRQMLDQQPRKSLRRRIYGIAAAGAMLLAMPSWAENVVRVTFAEGCLGTMVNITGKIDTSQLAPPYKTVASRVLPTAHVLPSGGLFGVGGRVGTYANIEFSPTGGFGKGEGVSGNVIDQWGTPFLFNTSRNELMLSDDYKPGNPLSAGMRVKGRTIAELGVAETAYEFANNRIVMKIGPPEVAFYIKSPDGRFLSYKTDEVSQTMPKTYLVTEGADGYEKLELREKTFQASGEETSDEYAEFEVVNESLRFAGSQRWLNVDNDHNLVIRKHKEGDDPGARSHFIKLPHGDGVSLEHRWVNYTGSASNPRMGHADDHHFLVHSNGSQAVESKELENGDAWKISEDTDWRLTLKCN